MRFIIVFAALTFSSILDARELQKFQDWMVICDDENHCVIATDITDDIENTDMLLFRVHEQSALVQVFIDQGDFRYSDVVYTDQFRLTVIDEQSNTEPQEFDWKNYFYIYKRENDMVAFALIPDNYPCALLKAMAKGEQLSVFAILTDGVAVGSGGTLRVDRPKFSLNGFVDAFNYVRDKDSRFNVIFSGTFATIDDKYSKMCPVDLRK